MQIIIENTRTISIQQPEYKTMTGGVIKITPIQVADVELMLVEETLLTVPVVQLDGKILRPFLVSHTEKINLGDWFYRIHSPGAVLTQVSQVHLDVMNRIPDARKVIALSEHFSSSTLRDIESKKLKAGKIAVECEKEFTGYKEEEQPWIIKFNNSNHITLHNEEKLYTHTEDQMIDIIAKVANDVRKNGFGACSVSHHYASIWFKENIKSKNK